MNGKRSARTLLFSVFLFWVGAVPVNGLEKFERDDSENARKESFFSNSVPKGFLSFISDSYSENPDSESGGFSDSEVGMTQEERILLRWKEKQLERWHGLPDGKFEINASAYTASADECGKSDGITASGLEVAENRTLACPPEYPFGVKINIEGFGVYRCEDRGGAIKGNRFDIYMETKREAFNFGRRNLIAQVVSE